MLDFLRTLFRRPLGRDFHAMTRNEQVIYLAKLRKAEADAKAAADLAAERHAKAQDEYARVNYYWLVNRDLKNAANQATGLHADSAEAKALEIPPPTPEQWAKLAPEQKANVADPVLPENLP